MDNQTSNNNTKIVLPNNILNSNGECTVLVQIDPGDDSSALDFTGASGAIGRLESDTSGLVLDLKGSQYQGRIYPGSTAMVLVGVKAKEDKNGYLKVDAVTDEFCRLTKTGDALAKLNAVTHGELYDSDEMQAMAKAVDASTKPTVDKEESAVSKTSSKRKRSKTPSEKTKKASRQSFVTKKRK